MTEQTEITNAQGDVIRQVGPRTVFQAWADVMAEVSGLGKHQRNDHQKFNFRGIDAVMNAVGPALRAHGVSVIPTDVRTTLRDVQTTQGKASREVTVIVEYTIVGPNGDKITGMAPGESMDAGDKATPKAMSVAFRTFLLQALCLPTDETDPDAETHERSAGPTDQEKAQNCADRAAKNTDPESFPRVIEWAKASGIDGLMVNVTLGGKAVTGSLGGYLTKRMEELAGPDPDKDAAAEALLKDSLGAQEIKDATQAGPTQDGEHQ